MPVVTCTNSRSPSFILQASAREQTGHDALQCNVSPLLWLLCMLFAGDFCMDFAHLHDKLVALARYREETSHDPRACFAVVWLSVKSEEEARACRKSIKAIERAKKFWQQ